MLDDMNGKLETQKLEKWYEDGSLKELMRMNSA